MDLPSASEVTTGRRCLRGIQGLWGGNAGFLQDLENTEQATEQATEMCPSAVLDQLGNSGPAQQLTI